MADYEILNHPADIKIKVFGKTKEGLFLNAFLGVMDILRPEVKGQKSEIRKIKIKSDDLDNLLVDFLNEVLYSAQTKKEIYTKLSL